ncbi:flagellar basal-body rod protein FlgG [Exilibacterium tricleocarpae]|uniref:Flagellar basal-body rod protein FlgG n=1 Tax=Exilibacterium tricleocarpae TaxID=2591008 RepID=A0A545T858_9GAMM|nr:flagellar basal-body rod protein FlgG [Exilibacterium tricleocarpae]TQV73403.1 flagellar basal-body rod protein FlgG [Exilibacterium tricleocarpae]
MLDAFHISAGSMQAHQTHVDVIANNLSNANTTGFKKSKVEFEDLMYRELAAAAGTLVRPDLTHPVGLGTTTAAIEKIFSQGEAKGTDRNLDLLIQGKGFFEVLLPDGGAAYSRTGHLQIDAEGLLVNADGYPLNPALQIPADAQDVLVSPEGVVSVLLPERDQPLELGVIELAAFMNPGGLTPMGDNLYAVSGASGDAFYGAPGEDDFGVLAQGFLEASNVSLIEELTNMMVAQRGYEMGAKVIQAADEMLGIINNLRR